MKITKSQLKQIIKEELLKENLDDPFWRKDPDAAELLAKGGKALKVILNKSDREDLERLKAWLYAPTGASIREEVIRILEADVISMEERRALKLLRDTVAFKAGLERSYSDFKWLPEIMDALEKSLGFQIFYLYHNDEFIETIVNTIKIIQNAPESALPELLKLVAKDGKIVDTPPEPPVEIPEDPDELKALAIKTVVDQLDEIGRTNFSNEMHAGAIFKKKTDDEEKSFWQRRKQYDADTDYISDHKGESPFEELWQQLNVQAALD